MLRWHSVVEEERAVIICVQLGYVSGGISRRRALEISGSTYRERLKAIPVIRELARGSPTPLASRT
jgi:hypothetical protein